ncbi:MAG: response regulator [Candidatus Margulisbacteria bacterium]|nr:response regulator [Candidatus Margulisiibacteriota bacterium]
MTLQHKIILIADTMKKNIIGTGKILFIDDDSELLHTLTNAFKPSSYDIEFYSEIKNAFASLKKYQNNYSLLLADLSIVKSSGFIGKALKVIPKLPIIIFSGYEKNVYLKEKDNLFSKYSNLKGYLQKPISFIDIIKAIDKYIDLEEINKQK